MNAQKALCPEYRQAYADHHEDKIEHLLGLGRKLSERRYELEIKRRCPKNLAQAQLLAEDAEEVDQALLVVRQELGRHVDELLYLRGQSEC